jgi:hypothetical protein
MREASGRAGALSVVLALAIVCTLVTVDRVVIARTAEVRAKQPGNVSLQCEDSGHSLTKIEHRRSIVYEKQNPGHIDSKAGIPVAGQAQQNCQAPNRRRGGTM